MSKRLENKIADLKDLTKEPEKKRIESKFSHIDPDLVIGLLDQGLRLPHIAAIYGCSPQTISYRTRQHYPNFDARKHIRWGRSDITVEDVVELYEQFPSSTKIAKTLGVNTHAITQRLEKAGVKRRPQHREDISTDDVVSSYRILQSTLKVAQLFRTNPGTVRRRLNEGGISPGEIREQDRKRRLQRKRIDIPANSVVKLYDENQSVNAIAKQYNASFATIRRILVKNGKEIRQHKPGPRRKEVTPEKVARW